MGFPSLQHIRIRRSTCSRVLPARFVPPSGFGYPRRLPPFGPLPVLFRTGGAPGIPPSECSPLERWPYVSARPNPPTVSLSVLPDAGSGRPAEPRFLGFSPSKSPWQPDALLTRRLLDTPLGFPPSRVYKRKPCPGFHQDSFHALSQV
jgi:hypothetical protein